MIELNRAPFKLLGTENLGLLFTLAGRHPLLRKSNRPSSPVFDPKHSIMKSLASNSLESVSAAALLLAP